MATITSNTGLRLRGFFCGFVSLGPCSTSEAGSDASLRDPDCLRELDFTQPSVPDPALAAVDAFQTATTDLAALQPGPDYDRPDWVKASKKEHRLWKRLLATAPTTLPGGKAYVAALASYPQLDDVRGDEGLTAALRAIAATLQKVVRDR